MSLDEIVGIVCIIFDSYSYCDSNFGIFLLMNNRFWCDKTSMGNTAVGMEVYTVLCDGNAYCTRDGSKPEICKSQICDPHHVGQCSKPTGL